MGLIRTIAIGAIAIAAGACGSRRSAPATATTDDAGDAGRAHDGAVAQDAAIDAALAGTQPDYQTVALDDRTAGHLRVKVEWPSAKALVRRSPGRTACGGPRPPRARIGTLHGVADVIVLVETTTGRAPPIAAPVRLTVRDCTVSPAMRLAPGLGGVVEVQSQDEAPQHVSAAALAPAWATNATATSIAAAALPMIGHTVSIPLAAPGVVRIALGTGAEIGDDGAYVVVPPHPYVAITDDVGAADLGLLPPGEYPVRAYLPPIAGFDALVATARATLTAGQDTELTLTLGTP